MSTQAENPSTTRFREYLRLKSVQPDPDYGNAFSVSCIIVGGHSENTHFYNNHFVDVCIEWLKKQADEIGLEFNIVRFESPNLFALWLTWKGTNPSLKSVMLNSHIDVVPVDPVRSYDIMLTMSCYEK